MEKRESIYGISVYNPPQKLMSACEYRKRVIKLGENKNLTYADNDFLICLEDLRNDLYDMITYNTDELSVSGNKYYISESGDDTADGLSPQTPWKTLQKVSDFSFSEGDGVYFKRGDCWRGNIILQSGVTYQAYGQGEKPKIMYSYDGKTVGKWKKTAKENIWVLDIPLDTRDIGVIVFDGGKQYAEKKRTIADLKIELDFCYAGEYSNEETPDNKAYLYCSKGNPSEIFESIELSRAVSTLKINSGSHDINIHNLWVYYGQDYFFAAKLKNIKVTYCNFAWIGGHYFGKNGSRFGGGGGCWHDCNNVEISHCYFTQQFDNATTPQFHSAEEGEAYFESFVMSDCLVEYTEYSFEYFNTNKTDNRFGFKNLYLGYNMFSSCGKGFGNKHNASRFIKGWADHTNPCYDCLFEHNILDRAYALSVEYTSRKPEHTPYTEPDKVDYSLLPKLKENIFIEPKDKPFAQINKIIYNFNEASQITLDKLGVQKNDIYIFDGNYNG